MYSYIPNSLMQNEKKSSFFGKEKEFIKQIQLYIFMNIALKCLNILKTNELYMTNK